MMTRRLAAKLPAAAAAAIGGASLAGWVLGSRTAAALGLRLEPMAPASGLCFVLCAFSLWARSGDDGGASRRRAGVAAAAAVALIAARMLLEWKSGAPRGLDALIAWRAEAPSRMTPCSAIAFLSASGALLTLDVLPRRPLRPSDILALVAAAFGVLALAGHAYGTSEGGLVPITGIRLPSSLAFLFLAAGILAARPRLGLAAIVTNPRLGGYAVRRLGAVLAVLLPLLVAAAAYGRRAGAYSSADAVTLTMGASLAIVLASVMRTAFALNAIDEARAHAEEQSQSLLEQAPDAIFVADLSARYTAVNDAACRMLGYTRAELLGMTILDLLPTEDAGRLQEAKERLLRGGIEFGEWRLRRKDGAVVPTEISAKILSDGRWQSVVRDISERRAAERALEDSRERLRLSIAELQSYSYTVSHNLRAPLRAIEGYAALMERQLAGGGPAVRDSLVMLRRISDSAQRLDRMIKDLLTYRVDSSVAAPLEAVDLDEIFAHESRHYGDVHPGALKVMGPLGKVLSQPSIMHRAVEALLDNALKAVPEGRAPRVEVHCEERDGGFARLIIEDNGAGMPPERLARLFEAAPRARGEPRGGVGLAVVKASIARLGGRLGAESTPGLGSRFWIELPRAA